MREGRTSTTAAFVSFARGVGARDRGRDRHAHALVQGPLGWLLQGFERVPAAQPALRQALRVASLGAVDHMYLRTAAIDRRLVEAFSGGIDQLVVLGAGLDARAWRMPEMAEVDVFEVDHPATQAHKRGRIGGHLPRARSLHYVPVDFERESFADALLAAGLDPARPTAWVWEGVVMYLPEAVTASSVRDIARISAPGSRLLATYLVPRAIPFGPVSNRLVEAIFRDVFGEEIRGEIAPDRLAALLAREGFDVLDDTSSAAWARSERTPAGLPAVLRGERLVHAIRS